MLLAFFFSASSRTLTQALVYGRTHPGARAKRKPRRTPLNASYGVGVSFSLIKKAGDKPRPTDRPQYCAGYRLVGVFAVTSAILPYCDRHVIMASRIFELLLCCVYTAPSLIILASADPKQGGDSMAIKRKPIASVRVDVKRTVKRRVETRVVSRRVIKAR